jgi:hypothetical protein
LLGVLRVAISKEACRDDSYKPESAPHPHTSPDLWSRPPMRNNSRDR